MNPLKFSVNIGLIIYTMNIVLLGGELYQAYSYFVYIETLVTEDMGEIQRTLLCQGPVQITSGRKRKK